MTMDIHQPWTATIVKGPPEDCKLHRNAFETALQPWAFSGVGVCRWLVSTHTYTKVDGKSPRLGVKFLGRKKKKKKSPR